MSDHPQRGLCAIILAAGSSRRFPGKNKLFVRIDGIPIIERVAQAISKSGVEKTIVITGADHNRISELLSLRKIDCIQNLLWNEGMGQSLATGVKSIQTQKYSGILVCLADLAFLETATVDLVISAFRNANQDQIVAPTFHSRLGHPIVFPIHFASQLAALSGDTGAKHILKREKNSIIQVHVDTQSIFRDIDTPEDIP